MSKSILPIVIGLAFPIAWLTIASLLIPSSSLFWAGLLATTIAGILAAGIAVQKAVGATPNGFAVAGRLAWGFIVPIILLIAGLVQEWQGPDTKVISEKPPVVPKPQKAPIGDQPDGQTVKPSKPLHKNWRQLHADAISKHLLDTHQAATKRAGGRISYHLKRIPKGQADVCEINPALHTKPVLGQVSLPIFTNKKVKTSRIVISLKGQRVNNPLIQMSSHTVPADDLEWIDLKNGSRRKNGDIVFLFSSVPNMTGTSDAHFFRWRESQGPNQLFKIVSQEITGTARARFDIKHIQSGQQVLIAMNLPTKLGHHRIESQVTIILVNDDLTPIEPSARWIVLFGKTEELTTGPIFSKSTTGMDKPTLGFIHSLGKPVTAIVVITPSTVL